MTADRLICSVPFTGECTGSLRALLWPLDVSALQTFERFLIAVQTEAVGNDHPRIAFNAAAMAVRVDFKCSLGAGHAQVVNRQTSNRYPGSYGKSAAMQIRAARLT
jgi:hypothetical protein